LEHQRLDAALAAMVGRLAKGSATAGELAEPFSIGLPTVSKHLRTLENAGLVLRERDAQWHVFRLRAQPLADVNDWLQTYEAFWLTPRPNPRRSDSCCCTSDSRHRLPRS
jgi:DNA-binding transcriptional ArsR family regulator